jgi:hypothetical protein
MSGTMRAVVVAAAVLWAVAARAGDGKPEKLLGLSADGEKGQVTFEVWTGGCTQKAHFRVARTGSELTLVRTQRDSCKMMPQRSTVSFTFAELGLKPHEAFTVANRFVADPEEAAIN